MCFWKPACIRMCHQGHVVRADESRMNFLGSFPLAAPLIMISRIIFLTVKPPVENFLYNGVYLKSSVRNDIANVNIAEKPVRFRSITPR
jgi:hypothetical protein